VTRRKGKDGIATDKDFPPLVKAELHLYFKRAT